ncbi:MAG: hypothetical protein M3Y66_05060 [Actinomycetota bacterium]|nr:hypothetical protein [Actinomycetota bacterium]
MKRNILAFGIAIALLLSASGCGGLNKDEQKAADSISKLFAGTAPTTGSKKVATCFSQKLVKEAGVKQLQSDKVIDSKLQASSTVPQKLSKKTAEAYADGLVTCLNYNDLKPDIKKQSGATDAQVSAYIKCVGAIDQGELKQSIVDRYTQSAPTAVAKKVAAASAACQKKLGR